MTLCKVVWDAGLEPAVSIDRGLGIPPSVLCRSPTWQPCTVTLRGLVDENHPILLLIYRAVEMAALAGNAPASPP